MSTCFLGDESVSLQLRLYQRMSKIFHSLQVLSYKNLFSSLIFVIPSVFRIALLNWLLYYSANADLSLDIQYHSLHGFEYWHYIYYGLLINSCSIHIYPFFFPIFYPLVILHTGYNMSKTTDLPK